MASLVLRTRPSQVRDCPGRDQGQPSECPIAQPRVDQPAHPGRCGQRGLAAVGYNAHSLRAGFVTYAHLRGASDRAIAHQSRHRSLATLGAYVRIHEAWEDNAATQLGL